MVHALATLALAAGLGLGHAGVDHLGDEGEAHLGDGSGAVEPALCLHLAHDVLYCLKLVFVELKGTGYVRVALYQLGRGKAYGDSCLLGMVFDEVHHGMQAAVDRSPMIGGIAEVQTAGTLLVVSHVQGMAYQLAHALVAHGRDGHHRHAEHALHAVDVDEPAVALHLVHHVEREHHRPVELHELHGQVEVTLDVGCIHDVDDAAGTLFQDVVAAHQLLGAVGRKRIDAGEVHHARVGMSLDGTVLAVDGDAGEVAHVLV